MRRPSISVVVTTYNRRAMLERVLEPLLADPHMTETVVVVDGSTDGSAELVETVAARDARIRPHVIANSGKERARAAGVERASGDVVLMLDDDVLPRPGLVEGHRRHHAEAERLVVVGYMPVRRPSPRTAADAATMLYASEYERVVRSYETDPSVILRKLWGGNVSLRREDALRVGLVSPGFVAGYHQDRDFGLRCLAAGLEGRFDRALAAEHLHRRSLESFLRDAYAQGQGRRQVHELHPEELGAFDPAQYTRDLPRPAAVVVSLTRRRAARAAVTGTLMPAVRTLGRLRLFAAQERVLRLLRRVHQLSGALAPPP